MKKIVLKIIILCSRCKACIIKIVAKFDGIVSISVDVEKATVTIIGQVDAAIIVKELRKAGKAVEIDSVGPHKKEEKKDDKKKKCEEECKKKCEEKCKKKCEEKCKKNCEEGCKPECRPECRPECKPECRPLPPCCNTCKPAPYGSIVWHENSYACTIL